MNTGDSRLLTKHSTFPQAKNSSAPTTAVNSCIPGKQTAPSSTDTATIFLKVTTGFSAPQESCV